MKRAATIVGTGLVALALQLAGCASNNNVTTPQPERAAEINLELGVEHLRKGNLQQAKEKIDRSLDQNPRSARAHLIDNLIQIAADERQERCVEGRGGGAEVLAKLWRRLARD